jgi:hypothetical protein
MTNIKKYINMNIPNKSIITLNSIKKKSVLGYKPNAATTGGARGAQNPRAPVKS